MTMAAIAASPSARITRGEAGGLFARTMGLVAVTAGFFALGAYLGRDMVGGWAFLWFIAAVATLFGLNAAVRRSEQLAVALLFAFGLLLGLAVAPTIAYFVGADPQAVWQTGGATVLFVAGFGAAGYATGRDLSALARISFWGLIALIAFAIVLIFVQIRGGALIYAIAGSRSSQG
jgi:modulator of FtsH protease